MHGDFFKIEVLGMVHPQFSSRAQRIEGFWNEFASMQRADYDRHDGVIAYSWVARYTREFLDAYLRDQSAAKEFLKKKPAQNGAPKHTMGFQFRAREAAVE
jgi:hypothetical protein